MYSATLKLVDTYSGGGGMNSVVDISSSVCDVPFLVSSLDPSLKLVSSMIRDTYIKSGIFPDFSVVLPKGNTSVIRYLDDMDVIYELANRRNKRYKIILRINPVKRYVCIY